MEFLTPLMLIGVAGAAVPLVIHLIGRRRAPIKRFGAMDFLFGTNKRVARRLRLREIVLLVVRVLSCVAIPLVLAKPFVSCSSQGVQVARGPQAVVIVLDNSYTMGWSKDGETLFAQAKDKARRLIDELGPEADVAIAFSAEGSEPPRELTRDHLRLLDGIGEARLSARPADTTQALRRAAAVLSTSPLAARRVYLFSTLAQTGFAPGETLSLEGIELIVVPLPEGNEPLPNVAVVSATAEKDPDMGPRGVRVTAELQNFGAVKVEGRAVTLNIGGKPVARGLITLGPGEKAQKRFSASLPGDARTAEVVVELDGDALAIDDRRYLRVELRRDVRVLLVDGDPRTVRHEDELFYLEKALRPGDRADSALAITTVTADELPRRRLADFDVVFLCNAKPLDRDRVTELEAWVKKGGGLLVSVGDNVDGDAWNAQMGPLLAQALRTPRQLARGAKVKEGDSGRPQRIGRFEPTHPIFTVFSAKAAGLREASFWKVYLLGPAEHGEDRKVLASYDDGAPALVEARVGGGRVLLWTSTIDRDWNDLPIHPGYLPFVQQIARYLARTPVDEPETAIMVGRSLELGVRADDERIEVAAPNGGKTIFEGAKLAGRQTVTFVGAVEPGFYHVSAAQASGGVRPRPQAEFVANLDPRGSDTRRLAPKDLPAGGTPGVAAAAVKRDQPRRRVELWHGLAAALLLFLLGEALLTRRG